VNTTENSIKTNRLNRYKTDEEIKTIKTAEQRLNEHLIENSSKIEEEENREDILNEASNLLELQSDFQNQLSNNYGSIINRLRNIHADQENYLSFVRTYRMFLDEKLMWVPTSTSILDWGKSPWIGTTKWLLSPEHWKEIRGAIKELINLEPFKASCIFLAFSSLLVLRRKLRHSMEALSFLTRRISTDSFAAISQLLLIVFLIASALPLPVAYLGWALMNPLIGSEFSQSFGFALLFVGCNVFTLSFLHELSRPKGVAEMQFRWPEVPLTLLRKHLFWFVTVVTIAGFVTAMMELQDNDSYRDSLGRFAFIITMTATAIFLNLLIDPAKGIFAKAIKENPEAWLTRISRIWYFIALAIPCALILLAVAGYYYAAVQLGLRLLATFWLVIIAVVLHAWGLRYFYVHERKIALEQALEKRKAASEQVSNSPVEDESVSLAHDEPDVDLSAVKAHPRSLLRALVGTMLLASVWMIWSGVLPALNFLNTFTIYNYTVMIDGNSILQSTTILDLIKFLMVCVITTAAAKNIPGVLEIVVLQNLPLQSGNRYAITTICQYFIVTIGILIAVSFFGIEWGQFGWILAALSVGLGFGLQEIVANFVCGILLFLERPIRVGDIVTVSDVTGIVNRIQIRATTIMNWERQEFIVPNKEFITGRILNWTLTNTVNRVTIPIGIAYGSDTNQARGILMDIALNHPEILNDPETVVIFEQFGDSSLNLSMRFYLPSLDRRLATIHDVHTQINERFNAADIEIPFPQRDIHVRSTITGQGDLSKS
jgi:potassium-dependent mechanosensitive channel